MMYAYRSTANCNADIGLAQSRCVIDAITNHCYCARLRPFNTGSSGHYTRLQLCNLGGLVTRQHLMCMLMRAFSETFVDRAVGIRADEGIQGTCGTATDDKAEKCLPQP
jgi:hypothetical protein